MDQILESSSATVMPSGTSSYTCATGHSVVIIRKVNNSYLIRYFYVNTGSITVGVNTGDLVWDFNENYTYIKFSTGGNDFVNFLNLITDMDRVESDVDDRLYWNGLLIL